MQPSLNRRQLEDLVVDYSHRLHARGWVANHGGNISACLADDRYLVTPSALSKAVVCRESLALVDDGGERISGRSTPFGELDLHLTIYRERPDVRAIVQAHPTTATGLAIAGVVIRPCMLAEAVLNLGDSIPLVSCASRAKTADLCANLQQYAQSADVLVLEHHGILALGPDLDTAYLRLELIEHLAKIQLVAMQAGGVRELPAAEVVKLLETRTQAGLGSQARAAQLASLLAS